MSLHPARIPFMAAAGASLLLGSWGGLVKLDLDLPLPPPHWMAFHGPLMVSGFLGTLIGLERAVGLGRRWAYAGPLLTAAGALVLLAGLPERPAAFLMTLGSAALALLFAVVMRAQPTLFHAVMGAGAVCWAVGNTLWLSGRGFRGLVFWWIGFLVLTVAGERLELTRLMRPERGSRGLFLGAVGLLLVGLAGTAVPAAWGQRLAGAGLVGLAGWLWRYDLARRTVRQEGLTRFVAVCLLSGYLWLAGSGVLAMLSVPLRPGSTYDAALHGVFLGFIMAMVFGHAPVILPAVLGIPLPYRPFFYIHLLVLHVSLVVRVVGDLGGWSGVRAWGGVLNAVALGLFLLASAGSAGVADRVTMRVPPGGASG